MFGRASLEAEADATGWRRRRRIRRRQICIVGGVGVSVAVACCCVHIAQRLTQSTTEVFFESTARAILYQVTGNTYEWFVFSSKFVSSKLGDMPSLYIQKIPKDRRAPCHLYPKNDTFITFQISNSHSPRKIVVPRVPPIPKNDSFITFQISNSHSPRHTRCNTPTHNPWSPN